MSDINKSSGSNINQPQGAKPAPAQAGAASNGAAANSAARQGAEAAQQGSRATGEAIRQGAEVTAEMTRQGAQVGAEAMRRNAEATSETLRRSTEAVAEGNRRIAGDAAQTFEQASRKIAEATRGTSENMNRLFELPKAAEGGLRDVQQSLTGLVEGVVQTNVRAAQELFRMGNPTAIVELQQRFMREYLDTLMQGTATMIQAIRRTADEAGHPLEAHMGQRRQEQKAAE